MKILQLGEMYFTKSAMTSGMSEKSVTKTSILSIKSINH